MTSTTYKKVLSCIYCNSSHMGLSINSLQHTIERGCINRLTHPLTLFVNYLITLFSINLLDSFTICLNWPVDILVQIRVLCSTIR